VTALVILIVILLGVLGVTTAVLIRIL